VADECIQRVLMATVWRIAGSAAAVEVVGGSHSGRPGPLPGGLRVDADGGGPVHPDFEFVSPDATLSFVATPSFVQFLGYRFDHGPVTSFTDGPGAGDVAIAGIPIDAGSHSLLIGIQASPQLPPRTPGTSSLTGTIMGDRKISVSVATMQQKGRTRRCGIHRAR
jgi:hypothetical protein